jgi:glycerophosphoryl diester phosphodiesterase
MDGQNPDLIRVAHRGGGLLAPENSLAGIERSLELGIEMIEVDVRRTRDDQLVLSHDPRVDGSERRLRAATLAEVRAVGVEVATLLEALDLVGGRARLNLDIKEPDTLPLIVDVLRRTERSDACVVSCLDPSCLRGLGDAAPEVERFYSYPPDYGGASRKAWLTPVVNGTVALMRASMALRLRRMTRRLPGAGMSIYSPLVTPALVGLAHGLGAKLFTWPVDDLDEMRRYASMGVDGITSNRPDLLAQLRGTTERSTTPA